MFSASEASKVPAMQGLSAPPVENGAGKKEKVKR
jgi:hypothetical protein